MEANDSEMQQILALVGATFAPPKLLKTANYCYCT
jgi:hypothetical protein